MNATRPAGFAALCLLSLLALGCSDDGPTTPQLPDSIGMEAGSDIARQVVGLARRFTTASFDDRPWDPVEAIVTPLRLPMLEGLGLAFEDCTIYGDSTDSDGDGVPDDFILTLLADSCTTSFDSATVQLSGSMRITDPGAPAGFIISYTNLQIRASHPNGNHYQIGLNGSRITTATTTASLHEDILLTFATRNRGVEHVGSISQNWLAIFTPANGATVNLDAPLPDGTLSLGGRATWTQDGQTVAFQVATPTPLVRDADCASRRSIVSGQLRTYATGNQGAAYIYCQFIGCGLDPIITVSARPPF